MMTFCIGSHAIHLPYPLQASVYGVTIGLIQFIALIFGTFWLITNFYTFYPFTQLIVDGVISRITDSTEVKADHEINRELPRIDILLPAYEEGSVIAQAIQSVREANYPQDKIQLYILLEPDDQETQDALWELAGVYRFQTIRIPEEYPDEPNKPRALNYGFEQTQGEIIGVIDAEDIIESTLFREVAETMTEEGHYVVQARLDMANEDDGWLNTLFRAEYGHWYELVLPAFNQVGYPIPLGGTSCFFRRDLLVTTSEERRERYGDSWTRSERTWAREHGLFGRKPWAPENVTEDFELGLFLWQRGFEVGYLNSVTIEQSPPSLNEWIKQRTRWKKGKLYTFFQYVRHPPSGLRTRAHIFWQSALPHLGPINIIGIVMLFMIANLAAYGPGIIVKIILSIGLTFALIVTGLFGFGYWFVSEKPLLMRVRRTAVIMLTLPIYWLLQWGADLRALRQAYNGRLHWEKTTHYSEAGRLNFSRLSSITHTRSLSATHRMGILAAILVVGVSLRVYGLADWSLWTDEVYSLSVRGNLPIHELLLVPNDPHPPLYYGMLHVWMAAFGNSAGSARMLSVLLSVGAILGVFRLGTLLYDDRVGLTSTLLFAVSTFHIHYGRTARMYSLFALLTVASWYWFVKLRSESQLSASGYLISSTLLLYTHVFAAFVVLAQHLYIALSESTAGINWRRWVSVQAILGILAFPWLVQLGLQVVKLSFSSGESSIGWIPSPSSRAILQTLLAYIGYPSHYPIEGGSLTTWVVASMLMFLYLGLLLWSVIEYRSDQGFELTAIDRGGQLGLLLLVPIVFPFVLSYGIVPVYVIRYTLPASLGLYLLIAKGLMNIPLPRLRLLLIGLIIAGSFYLIFVYHTTDTVEDWQGVAQQLEMETEPDDLVLVQPPWIRNNIEYYYDGDSITMRNIPPGDDVSEAELKNLQELTSTHERIWVVRYRSSQEGPVIETLKSTHKRLTVDRRGAITIYRFRTAR